MPRSAPCVRWTFVCAVVLALSGAAPAIAADTVVIDFQAGPPLETPVSTEYLASSFVVFERSDAQRPYRRAVGGGNIVANIGADRCVAEGGTGSDCEFPIGGTVGRLTRSASSVTLSAGLFSASSGTVTVQLEGIRSNGTTAATGPAVAVTAAGFTRLVRVDSAAADIARFRVIVGGPGAIGAAVGFDDLTMIYPAGSLPDVSLGVAVEAAAIPQGGSVDIPLSISRINGSNGALDMSATGLPLGVTAEFLPDPVPGTTGAVTLRLRAAPDAPPAAMGAPTDITITADPQGDGGVAPEPRTTTKAVRVASPYDLRAVDPGPVGVPACTSVDVPLRLERDRAFTGTVRLRALGLPPGMSATFIPGPDIPPGGGFFVGVTMRLSGATQATPNTLATVEATSPGAPTRSLPLGLRLAAPAAAVTAPSTLLLTAPQRLRPGSEGRITGNGFCPGTILRIGNAAGEVIPAIEDDGRALRFTTPRLATSGGIIVVPPGNGATYRTANEVVVDTFRSTKGFSFKNYPFEGLSLREAADVFGYDELFFKINPCWPWSNCSIITPVPDPTALLAYGIIDVALQKSGGHCFGISRAVQGGTANPATLNPFTSTRTPFSIPGRTTALDSFLDGQHALQASSEFIRAYFRRPQTLTANLATIRAQLSSGNWPLVSMAYDDGGHAVVAYDLVDRPDGGVDILVYDNNQPFQPQELTDGESHRVREAERSVIRVDAARSRWTFDSATGTSLRSGGGSKLFASAYNVIPLDPSLPGVPEALEGLAYVIFGSTDGSVVTTGSPAGGDYLPVLDDAAPDGAAGVIGRTDGKPITHTVRGVKAGRYSQAVVGDGFLGAVEVATAGGVRDTTSGVAGGDGVRFQALGDGPARALELDVGTNGRAASRRATISTRTSAGGADSARLVGGRALRYTHDGAPTTVRFTLQGIKAEGGPATFASGPLRVGRGETLTATPANWTTLRTVRLAAGRSGGRTRTRILRNRAKAPAALSITKLRVRGRNAAVTTRFARLPQFAAAGIVLRATRGDRVLARRTFKVEKVKTGERTFRWTIPRSVRGRGVRVVAHAALAVGGSRSGTVRRTRSVRVR